MWEAVATSPSATRPADTAPTNIVARLVDSAIVAARAPWRVKCSVVTNVTAAGLGSAPSVSAPGFAPVVSAPGLVSLIAHHLARDGYGASIAGIAVRGRRCTAGAAAGGGPWIRTQ